MLTRSMAINRIKQSTNRKNIILKWINFLQPTSKDIDEELQGAENLTEVQIALSKLTDIQQKVIELCYIDGNSHQKVADILGLPLGTIKTHSRRGLIAMRASLDKNIRGEEL